MALKATERDIKIEKKVEQLICQNCKEHKNNPGWCKKKKEYQSRKGTCRYYERKKR